MKSRSLFTILVLLGGCSTNKVSVWEENDALGYGPGTDANYTQGLEITALSTTPYRDCAGMEDNDQRECDPNWFDKAVNWLNFLRYPDDRERFDQDGYDTTPIFLEWGIGQQFYTPNELNFSTVQVLDRPYAGWLFGRLSIHNNFLTGELFEHWNDDQRRTITTKIGMVGPSSQASAVQKWWHEDMCDCTYPNGWHLQVRDEVGIVLAASQEDRIWSVAMGSKYKADFLTKTELSIGNVYTGLDVAGTLRFGRNLPRHFHEGTIGPVAAANLRSFHLYGFVGIVGRLVGRDIFLDGGVFKDSPHTVEKKAAFAEGQIGFGAGYGKWSLRVLYAHRGKQYDTQTASHRFGSFIISYTPTPN